MKQIFIITLLTLGAFGMSAQLVKFGPEIGLEATTFTQSAGDDNYTNSYVGGARLGIAFDIPIYQGSTPLYFQPSVVFRMFGGGKTHNIKYDKFGAGVPIAEEDERTYHLYRFQIPLLVTFKSNSQYEVNHFTFSIGPYVAANLGGNYSRTYTSILNGSERPVYEDRSLLVGNTLTQTDIKVFDFGGVAALGYEWSNGFAMKAYYELGLLNLTPGNVSGYDLKNQGGGLTFSYMLNNYDRR